MDWSEPGRIDTFRFVRVSWPGFEEIGEITEIQSCSYTENRLSDLVVSGKATALGPLDLGDDMVRAYSTSTFRGESVETCHFTMLASSSGTSFAATSGTDQLTLYSTLKVLADEVTDETLTVAAGTNPVAYARQLCEARELPVSCAPWSGALPGDVVIEPKTTILGVVNRLLGTAGYASATVDARGRVVMAPYEDASGKAPTVLFGQGGAGVLCSPDVKRTTNLSTVRNVVTLVGTDAEGNPLRSQARNDSPSSRWSTASRHRVVSRYEEVTDVTTQSSLDAKAQAMLREETMAVETVELQHFWWPFSVGDAAAVELPDYGISDSYSTTSRAVTLGPGMRCTTSARRFVDLEGAG